MPCACSLDLDSAGSSIAAKMAMTAMTTSNSMSVKPTGRHAGGPGRGLNLELLPGFSISVDLSFVIVDPIKGCASATGTIRFARYWSLRMKNCCGVVALTALVNEKVPLLVNVLVATTVQLASGAAAFVSVKT